MYWFGITVVSNVSGIQGGVSYHPGGTLGCCGKTALRISRGVVPRIGEWCVDGGRHVGAVFCESMRLG